MKIMPVYNPTILNSVGQHIRVYFAVDSPAQALVYTCDTFASTGSCGPMKRGSMIPVGITMCPFLSHPHPPNTHRHMPAMTNSLWRAPVNMARKDPLPLLGADSRGVFQWAGCSSLCVGAVDSQGTILSFPMGKAMAAFLFGWKCWLHSWSQRGSSRSRSRS